MKKLIKPLIILSVAIFITITYLIVYGFDSKIYYIDAFFSSGAIILLIGMLSLVSSLGAFNTFSFAGYYIMHGTKREHNSYGDYVVNKNRVNLLHRLNFIPYIVVGSVFILISIILNLIL